MSSSDTHQDMKPKKSTNPNLIVQKEASRRNFWLIIISLPDLVSWNVFILITAIFNYILVMVNISLEEDESWNFLPFYIMFDIIYLVNCLMLIGHKILNIPFIIHSKKINLMIAADVLSLLPQVLLLLPFVDMKYSSLVPLIRTSTLVRLRHLIIFKQVLRTVTEHRITWFLMGYITSFGVILHFIICIWHLTEHAANYASKRQESTATLIRYFYLVYGSIQILLNVGYGDVFPMHVKQLYLFFLMFVVGQILIVLLIANVAWLIIYNNFYIHDTYQKIKNVEKYVNKSDKVTKWITFRYYTLKQRKYYGDTSLLTVLPPTLQQDIDYDLNCGLLYRSLLLNNLPDYVIKKISSVIKMIVLPAGESIYHQFVVKSCMVCIEEGVLKVLSNEDEESPVVYFQKGTILGETALFLNIPSKATVTASVDTELRILEKQDFTNVMLHFPYYLKQLQTSLKLRLKGMKQQQKGLKNYKPSLRKLKDQLYNYSIDDDVENYYGLYNLLPPNYKSVVPEKNITWLNIWKLFNGTAQLIFCIMYPYYAVFEKNIPNYLSTFGICSDIACLLDIVLNCKFYSPAGINTSFLRNFDEKLSDWKFNFDLLSVFPIEIWAYLFTSRVTSDRFYNLFKLNRIFRLHKISEIQEIAHGNTYSSLAKKTFNTSLHMVIVLYYSCCLQHISSYFHATCEDTGWYFLNSTEGNPYVQESEGDFISSFYFTATTAFHTGIGDFLPRVPSDLLIITIIIIIFFILKYYWLGQFLALVFLNTVCDGYMESKWYLKNFSEFYHVSRDMKEQIISYLKINPSFYREKSRKYIHETGIGSLETLIQISRVNALHEIPLFENVDSYFLTLIEKEVKCWLLPKNEILYMCGDPTRIMFIIQEGFCKLYNSRNSEENSVGPGNYLGFLETIYCLPKKHTVITTTDCKLICIDYSILHDILKVFPKELYFLEKTKYDKQILEEIEKLEMMESESPSVGEAEIDEDDFVNFTKTWPGYFNVFRSKLGPFWIINFIFLPATIKPEGLFIKVWCVLRALLISLQGFILLVVIALPPFAYEIDWIEFASQLSLYVEMYLSLHIGYYDGNGMLKLHPAYTAWHYLTHGFVLDLICAIPWQMIMFHIHSPHNGYNQVDEVYFHRTHCLWNLFKLIQFYKVFKCLTYFQNKSSMSITAVKILKFLFFGILIIVFITSVGVNFICQYKFDENTTNVLFVNDDGTAITGIIECHPGFFKENSIWNKFQDASEIYTIGIYFIMNLATNTGIGDVTSTTEFMKMGTSFTVIIGFFLFATIAVIICSVIVTEAEDTLNFRENVKTLSKFLDRNHIHFVQKNQVMNHFELIWNRCKGFCINAQNNIYNEAYFKEKLLMQRNSVLQNDIPIFPNLEVDYLKIILGQMKVIFIQKGDVIIRYKDIISDIFVVVSGQVDIFDTNYEHIYTLESAGIFGNISKSVYTSSTVQVEARRNVELWILNTEKFLNIVKYYPLVIQDLQTYFDSFPNFLIPASSRHLNFLSATKEDFNELESDEELSMRRPSSMFLAKYTAFQLFIPTKWLKFTLPPNHKIFQISDFLTFFASLLNIYIIPYIFTTQDDSIFGYIYLCLEPIFLLRIFLKLHKAHVNFYGNLIFTNSRIWHRYLNAPLEMFWDIVPNLPVELIWFNFPTDDWFFYYSCFRLFHLLRFYYIINYLNSHLTKLRRKTRWYLANLLIHYSILVHYLACVWLMLACPFDTCSNNLWLKHFNHATFKRYSSHKLILSYYYILGILTSTGIGDVTPETYWEIVFTIMIQLVGKIAFALAIGTVLKMIYISERSLFTFNMKYNSLRSFLRGKDISDYPLKKTSVYLKKLWTHSEGFIDSKILDSLPFPLYQDIASALYGSQLRETFLFKDVDQSLLLQVCTKLRRTAYFEDDYIVKSGEVNSTMYFIYKGDVCVLSKHADHLETKHVVFHTKDIFGVSQGLNLEKCHNFCYRTITPVAEVLSLKYDDWAYLLQFFPRERKQIFNRVNKKYKFK